MRGIFSRPPSRSSRHRVRIGFFLLSLNRAGLLIASLRIGQWDFGKRLRRLKSATDAIPINPIVAGSGTADVPAICEVAVASIAARLVPWVLKALSINV